MASKRRVVSQQLHWVLELNWQFVILIALTLLHPGRSIISQSEVWRKSNHKLCFSPTLSFSEFLTIYSSTCFLLSLIVWALYSPTLLHLLHFIFLYTYSFVSHQWPSLLLSFNTLTSYLQRFPLSKEWNHLPGNGLQPSTLADLTLIHPLCSPFQAQIRPMTSLSRCSHSSLSTFTGIHSPVATFVLLSWQKSHICW